MKDYYLGVDVGGTKTHCLIADEKGTAIGFGETGPGNHEGVGYEGLYEALRESSQQAIKQAGIPQDQIRGQGLEWQDMTGLRKEKSRWIRSRGWV